MIFKKNHFNILHLNLKPERIIDFGLSYLIHDDSK